jgi:hypothetical protein
VAHVTIIESRTPLLQHPTIDRLHDLGLIGMYQSRQELANNPDAESLDHLEWLGILLNVS